RARELVALDPDQEDEPDIVVPAKPLDDLGRPDARADLVGGVDVDLDIVAEHAALPGILEQAVDGGERVRRNEGAEPLDDVAVVVVVRRLDQRDLKPALLRRRAPRRHQFLTSQHPGNPLARLRRKDTTMCAYLPVVRRGSPALDPPWVTAALFRSVCAEAHRAEVYVGWSGLSGDGFAGPVRRRKT